MRLSRVMFLLALVSVAASANAQITRNVPSQFATIQAAIVASANGDTVLVAPGTYNGAIDFLGRAITVQSSGGPGVTSIVGTPAGRVVTFATNEGLGSVLQGFRITGGAGGILCSKASPRIIDCIAIGMTVTTAVTSQGGAGLLIVADGAGTAASPLVDNSRFENNLVVGGSGGGVLVRTSNNATSAPQFTGCMFLNNQVIGGAGSGGGMRFDRDSGTINGVLTDCRIIGNTAVNAGGVDSNHATSLSMIRCRLESNTAYSAGGNGQGQGGAIGMSGTVATVVNCAFIGNSATFGGAGVISVNPGQTAAFRNCTITGNVSNGNGGIFASGSGALTIDSSVLWDNSPPQLATNLSPSVSVSYSNVQGPVIGGNGTNISLDPRFVDPARGDFHLGTTSPCVNSGNPGAIGLPATDIDGGARQVGVVDMGADEQPLAGLPGTAEDLDLYALANGAGDPLATTINTPAGTHLYMQLRSPGGTFIGAEPLIAGQVFLTGFPPAGLVAYPAVHIDNTAFLIYSAPGVGTFMAPGLDPAGVSLNFIIPPGLTGATLRAQGLALTAIAANGLFAVTDARDLVF